MAIDSGGGSGGGAKKQKVDEHDRCEAAGSDAIREDRISALPDELRLHILTHLPLKDAIHTGALARGWRDLWKRRWAHRASVEVHLRSRDDLRRELEALAREPRPRRRLERFSLIVDIWNLKSSELRRFLDYAAECGVEDLDVETRKITAADKLNFHLPAVSSPSLACLSLRRISVSSMYYKGARAFQALEVIRLVSVSFRWKAFRKMMALCPSLLILDLRSCCCYGDGWVFYELPPKLRNLTVADCSKITSPDFVRVPSLRSFCYSGHFSNLPLSIVRHAVLSDLYIHLRDSLPMKEWNIFKLRESLPKDLSILNVLTISYTALTAASVLSADGASAQLPNFNLHSLKELHLLMFEMKAADLSNLYLFLKTVQCPNLERLFVQFPAYGEPMVRVKVMEEPPEDGLDNLVMVKVMNFNWCPSEVQLVSFLLRKARSLRKLLIVSRNVTPVDLPGTPEADHSLLKEALVNGKIMLIESDSTATQPYHEALIKVF
ncbi:FBD-associated F-box protein At5g38590-like [Miscanthus floridulus]|uniref:FBD-associated F-box protein At5g38590-like n=1 Tax=Miscanthus floridulus TaxID=154761 RepID=UPI00345A122C